MISVPELENCPYCGRHATIVMHPGHNWDSKNKDMVTGACYGLWYVGCSYEYFETCEDKGTCHVHPAASWYKDLEEAIKHWNTRAKHSLESSEDTSISTKEPLSKDSFFLKDKEK